MIPIFITSVAAALLTQELSIPRKWGAVRASAFVSLLFGLFFFFLSDIDVPIYVDPLLSPVAMGASFVAMSSSQVIPDRKWMTVASIIFAALFLISKPTFNGYGGLLGTGACVSVIMVIGIINFYKNLRKSIS